MAFYSAVDLNFWTWQARLKVEEVLKGALVKRRRKIKDRRGRGHSMGMDSCWG